MQRIPLTPRDDWQQKVESAGLTFHSPEGMNRPYWDESAAYEFTAAEIDTLEAAANTLQEMCLAAAQHVIDKKRYAELDIPEEAIPAIEWAWNNEPPALYGRFDLSWAGASSGHAPKLLEYNADTPTSLLEAAVIQWSWLEEQSPTLASGNPDQFNSIHERLIAKWKDIDPYLSKPIYFAGLDNPEDQLTLVYLRDTAQQAGLDTLQMFMEEIGWNDEQQAFVDPEENPMFSIFKLYPWEAMVQEEFGIHAVEAYQSTRWIEPIWKMLLSNKGILPILWQLYPNHELLLESHFDTTAPQRMSDGTIASNTGGWIPVGSTIALPAAPNNMRNYVRKPLHSREGANITIVRDGATVATTDGPYNGPQIVQALAPEAAFDSRYPVLGLWMVDQSCCGLGIRESAGLITDNLSSFIPHYFA
ncbi:MAG: glutathionylspermidine synthase [Edaphobacter sp.]|nr:glutathionylspermidine synthase [Edaphobacter sp.]